MSGLREVEPIPENLPFDDNLQPANGNGNGSRKGDDGNNDKPHGTVRRSFFSYVQKVQRYSSYSFGGFLAMHAASVMVAPLWSIESAEYTLQFTAAIYQSSLVEPWLVYGSLGAHIASGLLLRAHKAYLSKKYYDVWALPKFSPVAISGFALTPLLAGHIWSTRIAPQMVLGDSSMISLNYIAHFIHKYPVFSRISYFMLGFLTSYHVIWGFKKWFGLYGKKYRKATFGIYFGALIATAVSIARIGRLPRVSGWVASQYDLVFKSLWLH